MKFTALLIVVAVCAALLPSDVDAAATRASPDVRAPLGRRVAPGVDATATRAAPDLRALVRRAPLEVAKRHVAKRGNDEDYAEFLASDEVATLLRFYGVTMADLDEMVDNDDEIDPEDRQLIKVLVIMELANSMFGDSSEEMFK